MIRRASRIDGNHNSIVKALRQAGCSVQSLAAIGSGCPDLLVARNGVNRIMEVKDGSKPPSQKKLTPDEIEWHSRWKARVHVVENVDQALAVMNL